jgi:hypothetical protein
LVELDSGLRILPLRLLADRTSTNSQISNSSSFYIQALYGIKTRSFFVLDFKSSASKLSMLGKIKFTSAVRMAIEFKTATSSSVLSGIALESEAIQFVVFILVFLPACTLKPKRSAESISSDPIAGEIFYM